MGEALPSEPPKYSPHEVDLLKARVDAALDKVRPAIQNDGGDIELVDVTPEGVAVVALSGHCSVCSLSPMTMRHGVERVILTEVPEIRAVEQM
jgi:Fe-S cluster biogenesis protein NfuA